MGQDDVVFFSHRNHDQLKVAMQLIGQTFALALIPLRIFAREFTFGSRIKPVDSGRSAARLPIDLDRVDEVVGQPCL